MSKWIALAVVVSVGLVLGVAPQSSDARAPSCKALRAEHRHLISVWRAVTAELDAANHRLGRVRLALKHAEHPRRVKELRRQRKALQRAITALSTEEHTTLERAMGVKERWRATCSTPRKSPRRGR